MSLNIQSKKIVIDEVTSALKDAETMVIAEYRGVSVSNMTKLRANARSHCVYLRVLKNTLVRRAVEQTSFAGLAEQMVGPLIYGVSTDPVAAAKVMYEFSKTEERFVIKAGVYDGNLINVDGISELATIPSKEELLAKLLGVMQAPVSGFARALAALAAKQNI